MACITCGKEIPDGRTTCESCEAPSEPSIWGVIGLTAAVIVSAWVAKRVSETVATLADGATASPGALPTVFSESPSRSADEIPGERATTSAIKLQRELEKQQMAMERMRMLNDHARTMLKTSLGQR